MASSQPHTHTHGTHQHHDHTHHDHTHHVTTHHREPKAGEFWMGGNTFAVPMSMHAENRAKLVDRMSKKVERKGAIILKGAEQMTRDATDHEPLMRQESYFQYLFGVKEADCFGAIILSTGKSILFIPRLDRVYQVWMGRIIPPEEFKEMYQVDQVRFTDEIAQILENELSGTGDKKKVFVLGGINTDSKSVIPGAKFSGIEAFEVDNTVLNPEIDECRVIKSKTEIELMRYAVKITSDAHHHVMLTCKPHIMEYQLEANFKHHAYFHGGARNVGYTCICATGSNGATLHYGHAGAPNIRHVNPGDLMLLDMGAEYHCYGADVTRTFPSNGKFSELQKGIYNAVLAAQQAVMDAAKPGVSWPDMHRLSEKVILEHLLKLGLVHGTIEELQANFVANIFMPHGLGHLLGLDTHDVGGYPNGMQRSTEPGLRSLRCGRKLEAGMIITVEPGIYFNWPELEFYLQNSEKNKYLDSEKLQLYRNFGGVRIEDDVLITETGCENLTTVPRSIEELEAILAQNPHMPTYNAK